MPLENISNSTPTGVDPEPHNLPGSAIDERLSVEAFTQSIQNLSDLKIGHLYFINTRQLMFTGTNIDKNMKKNYTFIDIQMPQTLDSEALANANLSEFKDAIVDPINSTKTLLTSKLFGYSEVTDLASVETISYYIIQGDGTPKKLSEKKPDKAEPGPYYWRKTDSIFFTSPTSASYIIAGAYNEKNAQNIYKDYMKNVKKVGGKKTKNIRKRKNKSKKLHV